MTKYIIEGNINFYQELYSSLDNVEDNNNINNICLISNKKLEENFIKMDCGHTFNYLPLFLDIKNHKNKYNGMEGTTSKLNIGEIRCPYCRKKQTNLLPYIEELNLGKINGVNYLNPNVKDKPSYYKYKICEFIESNPNYNENGINPMLNSFNKLDNCKNIKCSSHYASQINIENINDEKYYCWNHKKLIIKKYKQEQQEKIKEEIKIKKLKIKEELKISKEQIKTKLKEEKLKIMQELKINKSKNIIINKDENLIIGESTILKKETCIQILKCGKRKGLQCGCKVFENNFCKRHLH